MYYLTHKAILVEIKLVKVNSQIKYLIGNKIYDSVPESILDLAFVSANWNRALKFFTAETNLKILKTGYYMIDFDIFLDFKIKRTNFITKNYFFQKIIEQEFFRNNFMPNIFNLMNRYKTVLNQHAIESEFVETYNVQNLTNDLRFTNIHRFLISDKVDLNKYRFKDVFIMSDHFEIVLTNKNQRIYYLPVNNWSMDMLKLIDFIDLDNANFYFNNNILWEFNVVAEFYFENREIVTMLMNNIVKEFKGNNKDSNTYWHLFNVTNDNEYLIKGIDEVFTVKTFSEGIKDLEVIFKELKLNYLSYMLDDINIINVLISYTNYTKNNEDLEELNNILVRYKKKQIS